MSFSVDHSIPLLDCSLADGLCEMALSGAARTKEKCVFTARDEAAGCEVEDEAAIHLRVEAEIEVVERAVRISETGLLAVAAPGGDRRVW